MTIFTVRGRVARPIFAAALGSAAGSLCWHSNGDRDGGHGMALAGALQHR